MKSGRTTNRHKSPCSTLSVPSAQCLGDLPFTAANDLSFSRLLVRDLNCQLNDRQLGGLWLADRPPPGRPSAPLCPPFGLSRGHGVEWSQLGREGRTNRSRHGRAGTFDRCWVDAYALGLFPRGILAPLPSAASWPRPPLPACLSGLSAMAVSGWLDAWTDPLRLVSSEQWDAPRWLAARAPPVISLVGSRRDFCRLIHTRQWPALVRQSGSYDDALR